VGGAAIFQKGCCRSLSLSNQLAAQWRHNLAAQSSGFAPCAAYWLSPVQMVWKTPGPPATDDRAKVVSHISTGRVDRIEMKPPSSQ
jgi:hypothetical protein